ADRVMGLVADEGGRTALKVAVRAAPREGAANAALLRFLARLLELPPRDVTLAQGAAQRRKLLHIAGDPAQLARRMAEILHPWLTHA
ncbi:MAG TPA: DUF167 family protein, partial [Stellaceae bacterium]|nr:DUF167 family protein [Stellaceae bacterium]